MSAVRKSLATEPRAETRDVHALQDILYDILATGLDPEQSQARTEDIERFLFEHARTPKSSDEFQAFFLKHGLSTRAPKIEAAGSLALPALAPASEDDSGEIPVELALRAPVAARPGVGSLAPTARSTVRKAAVAIWMAVVALAVVLGVTAWQGYTTMSELQSELEHTAARGVEDRAALKSLRDHAAGLESSVAATGELVQRMDQKSDLLIDNLMAKPKPRRR